MIPIAKPLMGDEEKEAIVAVLESGILAQGPKVEEFERAFATLCGVRHAVATSSGTTALHLALLAHGIGPGDEVITSPFTFISSANSILFVGAKPVFVDPVTWRPSWPSLPGMGWLSLKMLPRPMGLPSTGRRWAVLEPGASLSIRPKT